LPIPLRPSSTASLIAKIVDVPTEADPQQFLSNRTADPANYRFASTNTTASKDVSSGERKNAIATTAPYRAETEMRALKPRSKATTAAKVANAGNNKTEAGTNPPVVSAAAPAAAQSRSTPLASGSGSDYNFGGAPTAGGGIPVRLGSTPGKSSFSLISNANAGSPMTLNSRLGDRQHSASVVRNLATDQVLNVRDYLPGFYGAPWAAGLGGNLVALLNVRVPSDAGTRARIRQRLRDSERHKRQLVHSDGPAHGPPRMPWRQGARARIRQRCLRDTNAAAPTDCREHLDEVCTIPV